MSALRIGATRRKPPVSIPPEKPTGKRRILKAVEPAPSILIVDDAEENRVLYGEYLSVHGLHVGHAVDGEHAVLKVVRLRPDLIVMDLAMPVLDGWEATRWIKAHPKTRHIPVIAVTGRALEQDLRRAYAAGADAVLVKPCPPEVLLESIRELLARRP